MLAPRKTLHSTPEAALREAFDMAQITQNDVLYDLGCGDGRCVVYAAKKFGIRCVGVEIDPERAHEAQKLVEHEKVSHLVSIVCGNALDVDIQEATIVFLFLIDRGLRLILPRLQQVPITLRVITYLYRFQGISPVEKRFCSLDPESDAAFPVYLYHIAV